MMNNFESEVASLPENRGVSNRRQLSHPGLRALFALILFVAAVLPLVMMAQPDHIPVVLALLSMTLIPILAVVTIHMLNRPEEEEEWTDIDSDAD